MEEFSLNIASYYSHDITSYYSYDIISIGKLSQRNLSASVAIYVAHFNTAFTVTI